MHPETDVRWLTEECNKAESFAELALIAIAELRKFQNGTEIVCGPITTGGRGNAEENLKVFAKAIRALQQRGRHVFNQMPYEERIFLLTRRWQEENPAIASEYHGPVLEQFYAPLFRTRLIRRGWFLPGWELSKGARWERQLFVQVGIEICDLNNCWISAL